MLNSSIRTIAFFSLFGLIFNISFLFISLSRLGISGNRPEKQSSSDSIDILIKIIDQRLVDGSWHDIQLRLFSYSNENILTEYQIAKYDNDILMPVMKIFNTVDQNGRLSGQTGKQWSSDFGGKWMDEDGGCHIKYDEKGNRIEYIEYIIENGREVVSHVVKSDFNESGKVTRRKIIEGKVSSIINDDSTMFVLNGDGKVAEVITKEWNNSEWVPTGKITSSYDEKGRIIEINYYKWKESDWLHRDRRIYKYNGIKNITEEIIQSRMFGKFQDEVKNISYLDSNGNMIKVEMQDYSTNAGWVTSRQTIYKYVRVPAKVPSIDKTDKYVTKNVDAVAGFKLSHNYPNPFNATTQIQYTVPYNVHISLKVYDILGREIAALVDETKSPGDYSVMWNGSDAADGVYFYRIVADGFSESRKMNLIK